MESFRGDEPFPVDQMPSEVIDEIFLGDRDAHLRESEVGRREIEKQEFFPPRGAERFRRFAAVEHLFVSFRRPCHHLPVTKSMQLGGRAKDLGKPRRIAIVHQVEIPLQRIEQHAGGNIRLHPARFSWLMIKHPHSPCILVRNAFEEEPSQSECRPPIQNG